MKLEVDFVSTDTFLRWVFMSDKKMKVLSPENVEARSEQRLLEQWRIIKVNKIKKYLIN